ncbi:MAG: O-antigen ligase family protein [Candidatus Pacebacteria bacterium]|nr:O-antigen ligase family protein [Candidatus Paceibacterota bacterium]
MFSKSNLKLFIFYLALAALFTPFLVDRTVYFPFIALKATSFRILVEIMAIVWVMWLLSNRDSSRPFLSPLAKAVIIYGIVILLSALFGIDAFFSFFSGNERLEGVFGIWHFILFFLILSTTFSSEEIKKLLKYQVYIGLFYSLVSPIKNLGLANQFNLGTRLSGLTGNPSYFAAYLIFNAFLSLYFFFEECQNSSNNKKNLFFLLSFCLESALVFMSGVRGAMIGYGGGLLIILSGILLFNNKELLIKKLKRLSLGILCAGVIFLVLIFSFRQSPFIKNHFVLGRLASISINDPTARSRLYSIGTAWRAFLEKPLLGWGPENYQAAYIKHFNPEVIRYLPTDFYFDRAHNKIMEVLTTTGLIGLISYLSIFILSIGFCLRLLRDKNSDSQHKLTGLLFLGLLAAYFVQNLFLFDFHESYLMFFLVLAFLSALSQEINPHILPKKQFGGFLKRSDTGTLNVGEVDYAQKLFKYLILTGVICAVFYSLSIWVIYPYLVSRRIILVGRYAVAGEEQKASQTLKSILLHPSFLKDDVIIGVKDTVFDVYNKIKPSTINKIVTMLLEEIPSVVAQRPSHYPLLVSEVQLRLLSAEWDKTALEKARLAGEKLIQIAPQFPSSYLVNAYVYLASKDYQQALEATNTALNFNSNLAEAHYLLGVIYENLNDSEKSYAEYLQALYNGFAFNNLNTIVKLLNLFQKYQNYEAMALLYEQAITLKIPTPDDYLVLIKLFGKIGNQEKVNFYTTKLNQIISNN